MSGEEEEGFLERELDDTVMAMGRAGDGREQDSV